MIPTTQNRSKLNSLQNAINLQKIDIKSENEKYKKKQEDIEGHKQININTNPQLIEHTNIHMRVRVCMHAQV